MGRFGIIEIIIVLAMVLAGLGIVIVVVVSYFKHQRKSQTDVMRKLDDIRGERNTDS